MDGRIDMAVEAGVMTLLINRPEKKNALTDALYHALADGMAAAEADDAVGAVLLAGAGGNFSTGNDLVDFMKVAQGGAKGEGVGRFLRAQVEGRKPLIAAVEGLAVGVGATTLFQCDLVYAAENADIRTPFVDLGLAPENGSSMLAPMLMGHQRAFELLALGEPFDARRAEAAGLVNRVVPAAELMAVALAAARRLAAKPRRSLLETRAMLRPDPEAVAGASGEEGRLFAELLRSPEARAAFERFFNRRK
ncbi:MAG: enoyl-CoA hydratase-related protein [Pikeienuella sp.]